VIEWVDLPNNIRATVCDKSSWARRGLAVQNTKIDPGFRGHITLELSNHGHEVIELVEGDAICQLEFAYLLEATDMPYKGKYQDQPDRPVEAITGKGAWNK
jgi:dCTP deaminase